MSNLINFFFSFDKLMKEKLVIAFFWLAIINFALLFSSHAMDALGLKPLEWLLEFAQFFVAFLMAIVAIRVLCEVAIAVFRINDNLSPDGGKSETADIDVIKEAIKAADEARKAAEEAAKKATAATKAAVARSKSERDQDQDDDDYDYDDDATPVKAEVVGEPKPEAKPTPAKPATKKAAPKKTAPKKTASKPAASKPAAPGIGLKKDGTPRKKPGPKPKTD